MRYLVLLVGLIIPSTYNYSQSVDQYIRVERRIDSLQHLLNGSSTAVSFGFSGNSSDASQLLKLNSHISFKRGTFPMEFSLDLKTETQVKDGVFNERLSDFLMTYDYYPQFRNSDKRKNQKAFVFLNRYSDAYLGIEEKYEIGLGGMYNRWCMGQIGASEKVDGIIKELEKDSISLAKLFGPSNYRDELEKLRIANVIKNTRVRFAFLGGVFYEIEKMVFTDSIASGDGKKAIESNFNATGSVKWEVRPTLEINFTNDLQFSSKCYFKMPFTDILENVVTLGGVRDSRPDVFVDFQNSLTYKLSPNVGLEIQYRLMYDSAPQRKFITDNNSVFLIMPDQRHHYFGMNFKAGF